VDRSIALLTPDFLDARRGQGCEAPDPIFVLGMPRAGSTLIEQILASHSRVEGTTELPDMPALARRIADYPQGIATLSA
ncbi:sulfotransferase, partial [Pseudomonas aeruginosa]